MNDALHDPDEFMSRLLSSPEITIDVPENATIAPTDDIGSHMLACATTSWWID